MLGRLRTASRPSRTVMEDAPYSFFFVVTGLLVAPALAHGPTLGHGPTTRGTHRAGRRGGIPDGSLHREVPTAPAVSASRAESELHSDPAAETSGPFAEETLLSLPVRRRGGGQARCLWMPWCHDPTDPIVTGAAGHPPMVHGSVGVTLKMILLDRGRRPPGQSPPRYQPAPAPTPQRWPGLTVRLWRVLTSRPVRRVTERLPHLRRPRR